MEVKGTAVETTYLFVEDRYGKPGLERWLAALPPASQEICRAKILPSGWYPLEDAFVRPTRVLCELFFAGSKRGAFEVGRYSAQRALTGIYKMFVKISTPGWLMERGSKVFETYYRPSSCKVVDRTDSGARMVITDPKDTSGLVEMRIAGWVDGAVEIHGFKSRKAEITKSFSTGDSVTQIDVSWA
jgi:hypothetical protein